jgi:hypothetical protein
MRLLLNHGDRRRAASASRLRARERAPERCYSPRAGQLEGPRDESLLTASRVPADPYSVWLQQREAEQEADRLRTQTASNPGAVWENLRAWDPSQAAGTVTRVGR